ncbi:hypothetical protein PPL_01139 [Heterostelium album PN500]|uniref:Uncharacterized protein n=1 Tax=Heterostelium pallidum (strain ATCC 26659 / Pp 5 / PN500) TaxID=670386 RepID=D3AY80_HETP5|nr:hypothetical protein PPL_01139 [Heterostelium album PN500]EFA85907.1 hypothetical protein PPL_01139 [Heterostelium album PN500]|eukprot:XP_020438013.1 hypothetical protein PPL_01139 [Heterostelium album PN500]
MYYNFTLSHILIVIFLLEHVYAKSDFLYGSGVKAGFNFAALGLIAAIIVGTPCFFIINKILKNYEKNRIEEQELREIQKKIMNRKNNEELTTTDTYGTSKLLKECIDRTTIIQILNNGQPLSQSQQSQPISQSDSSSSLAISTLTGAFSPPPQPQPRTTSCTFSKVSSSESISEMYHNNNNNHDDSECSSLSSSTAITITNTGGSNDTQEIINKLMTPPSPVLATFGKQTGEFNFNGGLISPINKTKLSINIPQMSPVIKRTIALDPPTPSPPPSARPKKFKNFTKCSTAQSTE